MTELDNIKNEIIKYGELLYKKGLSPATSGNISVKFDKGYLVTASGVSLGDLTFEDIIFIDENANILEGTKKPTSEKFLHLKTYSLRSDINAIIHCHSPKATAFSVAGLGMDMPILSEFVYYFDKIPLAKYATPSSTQLVENTVPHLKDSKAVLMANHGVITIANNLKNAFYQIETIEAYAEVYLNSITLGKMNKLSKKDIEEINKLHN